MKTLLIAALLTMAGWSGQVTVAAAAPTERQTQCDRQWNALPPTDPVRAPGYDRYLKFCLADCPGPVQHEDRIVSRGPLFGPGSKQEIPNVGWNGFLTFVFFLIAA